jgi:hypothetical protein
VTDIRKRTLGCIKFKIVGLNVTTREEHDSEQSYVCIEPDLNKGRDADCSLNLRIIDLVNLEANEIMGDTTVKSSIRALRCLQVLRECLNGQSLVLDEVPIRTTYFAGQIMYFNLDV